MRPGCECPKRYADGTRSKASERCTAKWIRCKGAMQVVHEEKLKAARELVAAAPFTSDHQETKR